MDFSESFTRNQPWWPSASIGLEAGVAPFFNEVDRSLLIHTDSARTDWLLDTTSISKDTLPTLQSISGVKVAGSNLEDQVLEAYYSIKAAFTQDEIDAITGTPTSIEGGEGMISARFQEHSWITDDGVIHILPNTGELTLYTAVNGGESWDSSVVLPGSDASSTSDGVLIGDELYVAFSTDFGSIAFSQLAYSDSDASWEIEATVDVARDRSMIYERPSVAKSDDGTLFVSYTATNRLTGDVSLMVSYSMDGGASWVQAPRTIPSSTGDGPISGEVIVTDRGVGLLYKDGLTLKWAEFTYPDSTGSRITNQVLIELGNDQRDPNATHFSSVTDPEGNIHVATNNGEGQVVYLRYDSNANTWSEPEEIVNYRSGDYMQMSIADDGTLYITYNARIGLNTVAEVSSSSDGGVTWSVVARLSQDEVEQSGNVRVETPGYIDDELPVFQQVQSSRDDQSLVFYEVG